MRLTSVASFPGRVAIESYGNGGFRFGGMSHRGSILCLPSGVYAWEARILSDFTSESFRSVLSESELELLLVGCGLSLSPLPPALLDELTESGIRVEPMDTGAAARTYNVLLAEGRSVGAALLAID